MFRQSLYLKHIFYWFIHNVPTAIATATDFYNVLKVNMSGELLSSWHLRGALIDIVSLSDTRVGGSQIIRILKTELFINAKMLT